MTPRPSTTPRDHRGISQALESYGTLWCPGSHRRVAPPAHRLACGSGLQHRRGCGGSQPRGRGAALCELMGIPYTGSDAATLSIALDKACPRRSCASTGFSPRVPVDGDGTRTPVAKLVFPLIVKPNQEGSSKGVSAHASVVDDEASLRPWCEICWRSIASLRWWSITWPVANSPWDCSATSARVSCRPWRFSSSTRTTRGLSTTTRSSRNGKNTFTTSVLPSSRRRRAGHREGRTRDIRSARLS